MQLLLPPSRELKYNARRAMSHPASLRATVLLVAVSLALFGMRYYGGGTLSYGLASLATYGDTASGFYVTQEGFSLIFRMDLTGMVLAIPVSYSQLKVFLILTGICFLILSPLRLGTAEQYWSVLRGEANPRTQNIFQWFTQGGRLVKSLVVEFVLRIVVRAVGLVAMAPSLYLYYLFYTTTPNMESFTTASSLLQMGAVFLGVIAGLFTLFLHSLVLPVQYCLAAHPEYSLGMVFRRGFASTKGVRGAFFRFRMSYIVWFFLSQMSYNALDLYVLPYSALGSMLFIQEAARAKQTAAPNQTTEQTLQN